MTRFISVVLVLVTVWAPSMGYAIWGVGDIVFDPTSYVQSLATAVSVAEDVRLTVKSLSQLADMSEYAVTIAQTARLVNLLSNLAVRMLGRYGRWYALIPTGNMIPCTVSTALTWNRIYDFDTRQVILDIAGLSQYAGEARMVLESVESLLDAARGIVGDVSGLQSLHTVLTKILQMNTMLQATRGPMDEHQARVAMRAQVNHEAAVLMSHNRRAGMHGWVRKTCQPMPEPLELLS